MFPSDQKLTSNGLRHSEQMAFYVTKSYTNGVSLFSMFDFKFYKSSTVFVHMELIFIQVQKALLKGGIL